MECFEHGDHHSQKSVMEREDVTQVCKWQLPPAYTRMVYDIALNVEGEFPVKTLSGVTK